MASGSQNMTTYNARTVTGSNSAASPAGALLLSGAGRASDATGDTWIFLDSLGGTSTPWGIKHDQANNKIHIYGNNTDSVWTRMDTGDTYILGKVGIGYDPETSENTYKLYVNGSSYFTDHMYIGRNNSAHIYLINKNWTKGTNPSSQTYSAIEYNDVNNSRVALLEATLDTSGNSQFNIFLVPNVTSSTSWSGIILQKTTTNVLTVNIAGATTVNGHLFLSGEYSFYTKIARKADGGGGWAYSPFYVIDNTNTIFARIGVYGNANTMNYMYIGAGDYNTTTHIRIDSSGHLVIPNDGIYYQGTKEKYRMIRFIDNTADAFGNGISIGGGGLTVLGSGESADTILNHLSLTAAGGTETTYIGSDGSIIFYPNNNSWDASAAITMTASHFWVGVNGNTAREAQVGVQSGAGQLYMWSHAATSGSRGIYTPAHGSGGARAIFSVDTNNRVYFADSYNGTSTALAYSQAGLAASAITWLTCWNGYELRAISKAEMANAVDSAHKWVRRAGDTMTGLLNITTNGNTVTIGAQNSSCCHIYNSANIPFAFNRGFIMVNSGDIGSSTFPTGNIIVKSGGRINGNGGTLYLGNSNNANWVLTQDICSHNGTGDTYWSLRITGVAHFKTAYGAVWNDYAEMRNVPKAQIDIHRIYDDKGEIERNYPYAGHCVYEIGDGTMELTNARLAKGCKIISDTFGFCIGETEDCKTPIAITGRVLAYPYENIEIYKNHIGDFVCSGPNGTISIMSSEEAIKYPECIVGTISEIPTYTTWRCGNKDTKPIQVNGRIWIYVR